MKPRFAHHVFCRSQCAIAGCTASKDVRHLFTLRTDHGERICSSHDGKIRRARNAAFTAMRSANPARASHAHVDGAGHVSPAQKMAFDAHTNVVESLWNCKTVFSNKRPDTRMSYVARAICAPG